jgi:acyl-CoA synthetase (AMP-forming)/AMP-acid ligase II
MPFLTEKLSPDQYRQSLISLIQITAPAAIITYPEFFTEIQKAIMPDSSVKAVLVTDQINPHNEITASIFGSGMKRIPQDIVLLQHSSGTTGLQKGVALSHQAIIEEGGELKRVEKISFPCRW